MADDLIVRAEYAVVDTTPVVGSAGAIRSALAPSGDEKRRPGAVEERLRFLTREVRAGRIAVASPRDVYRGALEALYREVADEFDNPTAAPHPDRLEAFGSRWVSKHARIYEDGRKMLDFCVDTILRAGVVRSRDLVEDPGRIVLGLMREVDVVAWPRVEAAIRNALAGIGNRMRTVDVTIGDPREWRGAKPAPAKIYSFEQVSTATHLGAVEFGSIINAAMSDFDGIFRP